jgi:hypothetical protein
MFVSLNCSTTTILFKNYVFFDLEGAQVSHFGKITVNTRMAYQQNVQPFKGTVQLKLTGVLSGINRMLMICSSVAWYFYLNLKSLVPLNLIKRFSAA